MNLQRIGDALICIGFLILIALNVYQYISARNLKQPPKAQLAKQKIQQKAVKPQYKVVRQAEDKKVKPVPVPPIKTKIYVVEKKEVCEPKVEVVREYTERRVPPFRAVVARSHAPARYTPKPAPAVYGERPHKKACYDRLQREVVRVAYRDRQQDGHQLAKCDNRYY